MAKILVIEDDADLSEMIGDALEPVSHVLEFASDGTTGMQLLESFGFDLIILDWMLPGMTGPEICAAFRRNGGRTPVLMLTGRKAIGDVETGLDAGADDYLTKPFESRELIARVKSLLRRPPSYSGDEIRFGDLCMFPALQQVIAAGTTLVLHPREFALLKYLIHNPNVVFSHETLLNHVWPSEDEATINGLRACIRRIRHQMETSGCKCKIASVYGTGYRLEV